MTPDPSIDRVDPELLSLALRTCGIELDKSTVSHILDVVVWLEVKGDEFDLMDAAMLKAKWGYLG